MTHHDKRPEPYFAKLAAFVLLLAAGTARADTTPSDDAKRVQAVIDVLKAGDVSAAVAKLGQGEQLDALAAHPDLVHVLCDRAFRFDNQKAGVDARRTLAGRLFELATLSLMQAPDDDRARWALAEATVLRERAGNSGGAEAWNSAADLLEKVHAAHANDGLPLAYAVSFLLEGACANTEAALPLVERADALAKKAMDSQKDSPTLAGSIATSQLWAAKALLAPKPKISKMVLKATLDTMRPFATRVGPSIETATVFNDAVAFGKTNGFALPDKFVTSSKITLEGSFQFDFPVSSRWSVQTVAATEDASAYDYVTELAPDGTRKRQILFRRYAWSQRYTFLSNNPIGGDNVKSLASSLQAMSAERVFAKGAQQPEPKKRSCSKSLEGYVFEVRGSTIPETGTASEPLRLYACVMRGRSLASYAVLVYVYGKDAKDEDLGPEMESLLSSLREPDKNDK